MFARLSIFDDVDLSLEEQAREWMTTEGLRLSRALPGYQGLMTLIDRDSRRVVGIGLYDNEENARQADELLNQAPPESLPEELRRALPARSFVGLFDVVEREGI